MNASKKLREIHQILLQKKMLNHKLCIKKSSMGDKSRYRRTVKRGEKFSQQKEAQRIREHRFKKKGRELLEF